MFTSTLDETGTSIEPTLTAADRCDQCGARAWVRVTMSSGDLYFCAHHAQKHMDALRDKAQQIIDERDFMPL